MFALDKPMGPSAFQALCALRDEDPALRERKLGHTGRLDPLAEGLLAVLVDDENQRVVEHRGADKTYELGVLFGVATDSFDSLGVVTALAPAAVSERALRGVIPRWVGAVEQRCAPFSQAKVGGRSLISLGHSGEVVDRPARPRVIASITLLGLDALSLAAVAEEAARRVDLVRGSFRQDLLRARWSALSGDPRRLTLARLSVDCSAGTFMRSLAFDLGEALGLPALAWTIRRTRVGALTLEGARRLSRPWRPETSATPTPPARPAR
ncbi:MAG: hypothetical protein R3A48_05510 [Polyangiales bacterium]